VVGIALRVRGAAWVRRLRMNSRQLGWALDLRLSLLVLFGLSWLAQKSGTSLLIAGFGAGLMVAAVGGPKRLSGQVLGIAQGFFVPLFFVVLGARLDLRALFHHAGLLELAATLIALNVAVHALAAIATRQRLTAGLITTAQLGVPAAVVALGLSEHVIAPGQGAAIIAAALISLGVCSTGAAVLQQPRT
jgi:Kef-type K+ transport system membrane component KefB